MMVRSESFDFVNPGGDACTTLSSLHRQMTVKKVIKVQCINWTTSLLAARATLSVLTLVYLGDEEMGLVNTYRQE